MFLKKIWNNYKQVQTHYFTYFTHYLGDDAADAKFYDISSVKPEELAFDHSLLFKDLVAFLAKEKGISAL